MTDCDISCCAARWKIPFKGPKPTLACSASLLAGSHSLLPGCSAVCWGKAGCPTSLLSVRSCGVPGCSWSLQRLVAWRSCWPAGSTEGSQGCVWFASQERIMAPLQGDPVNMWTDCYLSWVARVFRGRCVCGGVCVCGKWLLLVLSLARSSWIGPISNSKWTSESAHSASCRPGLGLFQQELAVLSPQPALQSALQSRSSTAFALRPDSQTRPLSFSVAVPQPEHRHIMSNSSSFFMCFAGSPSRDCGMFYSSSGFLYTKEKPHHSLSWLGSSLWWISSLRLCEALLPLGLLTLLGCVRDGHCAWGCKRAAQLGVFSCQADGLTLLFVSFEWTALRNNCTDEVYVFYLVLIFLFT